MVPRGEQLELEKLDEMPEVYPHRHLKKAAEADVEDVELYLVDGLPVYEIALRLKVKGWVQTGRSRYKHVTDERVLRIRVRAKDGEVLNLRNDKASCGDCSSC